MSDATNTPTPHNYLDSVEWNHYKEIIHYTLQKNYTKKIIYILYIYTFCWSGRKEHIRFSYEMFSVAFFYGIAKHSFHSH